MAEVSKSAAKKVAEVAADGVADGLHVVGEEALAAEAFVQQIDGVRIEFLVIGIAAGVVVGALGGYRVAVKRLEKRYEELMEEEGERLKEHYVRRMAAQTEREEKPAAEELGDVVEQLGYTGEGAVVPPPVPRPEQPVAPPATPPAEPAEEVVVSVFEGDGTEEWDYAEEVKRRSPEVPYIITAEEYRANEGDLDQMTWTYFAGDDVLANEAEEEVDQDSSVGVKHMGQFGYGSGDPNVVYVRNVVNGYEVEVIRSHGTYAHEVKGLDDHNIRHSQDPPRRVTRQFDDER
jgi:hypothetical protein